MIVSKTLAAVAAVFAVATGSLALAGPAQAKTADFVEPGTYMLQNKLSARCLDVIGGGTNDENNVGQWDCLNTPQQRWTFESAGGGYYYLHPQNSGKCLDVDTRNAVGDFGGNVFQYHCWGGTNQQWFFQKTADGFYGVTSRHNGKALDLDTRGGLGNGANVHNWTNRGDNNQQWKLIKV
jgi:hypothetical protein